MPLKIGYKGGKMTKTKYQKYRSSGLLRKNPFAYSLSSRIAGILGNKVYKFKRTWQASNINSAVTFGNSAFAFKLSDLPNSTEFTTLFDSYRITGVKMTLIPQFTQSDLVDAVPGGTNKSTPNVYTVLDYDDNTALSNAVDYFQYDTFRLHRGARVVKRFCRPKLQASANVGGAGTLALQESNKRWVDCNQASVLYFGIKVGLDSTTVATDVQYRVYFTYYLDFKSVR